MTKAEIQLSSASVLGDSAYKTGMPRNPHLDADFVRQHLDGRMDVPIPDDEAPITRLLQTWLDAWNKAYRLERQESIKQEVTK
jgi:hypothetical protein